MEEVNMDVKGSKLVRKIVNLWKRLARSDGRSRNSRLNTPADPSCSCSCSDSNCPPLRTSSLSTSEFNGARGDLSGNCFNLMPSRRWQIRRRLSSHLSFIERNEGKNKVKGWIDDNNNGCSPKHVPKGFIAIYVGDMQEEQQRFVIPVFYFNHPLFMHLLREAEEVYGFDQKGVFTIPCQVSDFEYLQWLIEREERQKSVP